MPSAGELATAPFHATSISTSSSATFTANTLVDSIVVNLVSGVTYAIQYHGLFLSSVANDVAGCSVYEDSISGTTITSTHIYLPVGSSRVWMCNLYGEYTAVSTAAKTFAVGGSRATGTGNIQRYASATTPAYVTVDSL